MPITLINQLKESSITAECRCGGEFKLSEAILFDGTKPFPKEALEAQEKLKQALEERKKELEKRIKSVKEREEHTKKVNVGKNLEKILPTMKDFKWQLPDCRFLADPIDLITFNGFSLGKVDSISFIEVKTGENKLGQRQKSIKDAIEDQKVSYKEYK